MHELIGSVTENVDDNFTELSFSLITSSSSLSAARREGVMMRLTRAQHLFQTYWLYQSSIGPIIGLVQPLFAVLIHTVMFSLSMLTSIRCLVRTKRRENHSDWTVSFNFSWWWDLVYGLTVPTYLFQVCTPTSGLYTVSHPTSAIILQKFEIHNVEDFCKLTSCFLKCFVYGRRLRVSFFATLVFVRSNVSLLMEMVFGRPI